MACTNMLVQPTAAIRSPFHAKTGGQRLITVPAAGRRRAVRLPARAEGKVTREYNEGDGKVSDGKKPLYADEAPVSIPQMYAIFCAMDRAACWPMSMIPQLM
jgi:hypothetical protein